MLAPQQTPLIGRILDEQFRLERWLGRGNMGEVYLAEQLAVERRVVIKLLSSSQFDEPHHEERFRYEARALAQLNHPNVVHLYTFGRTSDGLAYLAMEYVEGRTLGTLVADRGAVSEPEVLDILEQLCSALVEAHRRGVIHRDLKPENVMLTQRAGRDEKPRVKVLDFGIAKLTHADLKLTRKGEVIGTPLYMAPEQLRGIPADARADIYALGVIGYELITGQLPIEGDTTTELFARVQHEVVHAPHLRFPKLAISASIEAVLMRCLEKNPAQRYQTATELQQALQALGRASEPVWPTPRPAARAVLHTHEALRLSITEEADDTVKAWQLSRRRARAKSLRWFALSSLLVLGVAALSWFDIIPEPLTAISALEMRESSAAAAGPLLSAEWVQGIPFPVGTEYVSFEEHFIDARVPASQAQVLAFYRLYLTKKWGGVEERELDHALMFASPVAPVARITVTTFRGRSRIFMTRRQIVPLRPTAVSANK